MKQKSLVLLSLATIVIAGLLVSIAFAGRDKAQDTTCASTGSNHKVVIENDTLSPNDITAARCDTITITNLDSKVREIGFGEHDKHVAYDGITERILGKGEHFSITLQQMGRFFYQDHFQDDVEGYFSVRP